MKGNIIHIYVHVMDECNQLNPHSKMLYITEFSYIRF
jgi:hypothetical protein